MHSSPKNYLIEPKMKNLSKIAKIWKSKKNFKIKALFDSKATGYFINKKWASRKYLKLVSLKNFIKVRNIDRTSNKNSNIIHKYYIIIEIKSHIKKL